MLKKPLISTAALGALVAASAITPASAQHANWDWSNQQNQSAGTQGSAGYHYGHGYRNYGYAPDYGYAPAPAYYGPTVSFGVGVGPAYGYGPRHYGW